MSPQVSVAVLSAVAVVVLGVPLWAVRTYDRLVSARDRVDAAAAGADVALARRHELVRRFLVTVGPQLRDEGHALDAVLAAHARAAGARGGPRPEQAAAEAALGAALAHLHDVCEQHEHLRSRAGVVAVRFELARAEVTLTRAQGVLNEAVRCFNTLCVALPAVVVGRLAGLRPLDYLRPWPISAPLTSSAACRPAAAARVPRHGPPSAMPSSRRAAGCPPDPGAPA